MSNVTLEEIASLVAKEFGIGVNDMSVRSGTTVDRPQMARDTYYWLARRHTPHTPKRIALAAGLAERRVRERIYHMRTIWGEGYPPRIAFAVARVEEEIDRIHEARLETMERLDEGVRRLVRGVAA